MQNLSHIQVGDVLATKNRNRYMSFVPAVNYKLWKVTKRTATQIVCEKGAVELRVRASDGQIIGEKYERAIEATPEIIATTNAEIDLEDRYLKAMRACDDLVNQPLHRLNLSTKKIEALAKAWEEIKAMED